MLQIVFGGAVGAMAGLLGLFAWGLCKAAAAGDAATAQALEFERRQVGVCGSCVGPVMLDPGAAHATCPCGQCVLPRAFLRYGEPV